MKTILDLTKPLNDSTEVFTQADYRDPDFLCSEWSSVEKQGYRVSAITMGTQTGTHIDAPNHFDPAGDCLDSLAVENLVGRYFLLDLPKEVNNSQAEELCVAYNKEGILFVRSAASEPSCLTLEALDGLLALPPLIWVLDGEIKIADRSTAEKSSLEFHRRLAYRGKYLIENLYSEIARKVTAGGELIALPLALVGTSGAPCRVLVRALA